MARVRWEADQDGAHRATVNGVRIWVFRAGPGLWRWGNTRARVGNGRTMDVHRGDAATKPKAKEEALAYARSLRTS